MLGACLDPEPQAGEAPVERKDADMRPEVVGMTMVVGVRKGAGRPGAVAVDDLKVRDTVVRPHKESEACDGQVGFQCHGARPRALPAKPCAGAPAPVFLAELDVDEPYP